MQKKAIIIGATGRVGQALVRELGALYQTLIVIARTPPRLMSANMQFYALADFENLPSVLSAIALDDKTDAFCCLWSKEATGDAMLTKIHYDYPYRFATLCYDKGIRSLFLLSKAGANINSKSALLSARGRLHQKLEEMAWQSLVIFMVDKVELTKELSLRGVGKQLWRLAERWLMGDEPLSPSQIAVSMALSAFYRHHQSPLLPAKSVSAPHVYYITHKQMSSMSSVLNQGK